MFYLRFNRSAVVWFGWAMVCAVATTTVAGQQSERTPPRPEYVIEFHTTDGCLFAPIAGPANRGSLLYALRRPGNYLPDSSGRPILSKIAVHAEQTGELWSVKVAIGAGEFYDAGDQQIAAFTLRTNERADVGEAARFGLGPFRVGVVKVLSQDASKPRITFKTQSISVEKLEVNALPEPYHLFLKNNSDKDVLAIQYNTYKDQQFLHLNWLELPQPRPLIKAGDVYRFEVLSQDRTCADPDGYRPVQSNRIEIATVVFVDGSYEGDAGLAALVRGNALGNKKDLERVVATLSNLGADGTPGPELLIFHLKYLSEELDEVADPALVDALQNGLPPMGQNSVTALTNFIRSGQHEIKTSLLRDAQQLEAMNKTQKPEAVREWCAHTIEKYKQWLARAEAVSAH
jgi:hypothetical protein